MARRGSGTKREFLMLAHTFEPRKYHIPGWFMSEKLDGMRFFWDGGITRNMYTDQVPWANVERDSKRHLATGLWSRYGKVIHAPSTWLDSLPKIPLDGELYLGRQKWQALTSIVRSHDAGSYLWGQVKAAIFDSPAFEAVFADGVVDSKPHFTKTFTGIMPWAIGRAAERGVTLAPDSAKFSFKGMIRWLEKELDGNPIAYAHKQIELEHNTPAAMSQIDAFLNEVVEARGEGIILRKNTSIWMPQRSHEMLKYKPYEDAEATVTGYVWGRETPLGSKLMGLMGAMVLDFGGVRFELSGFTDAERRMEFLGGGDSEEGYKYPGTPVSGAWTNPMFPIGSRITFKYRELSDTGVPKEGRFLRKEVV